VASEGKWAEAVFILSPSISRSAPQIRHLTRMFPHTNKSSPGYMAASLPSVTMRSVSGRGQGAAALLGPHPCPDQ
jgi:hypothetical protein